MPYNTRRKSLSLPSLGIHVPVTHAARAAAAAAAAANRSSTSGRNHGASPAPSSSSASSSPSSSASSPTMSASASISGSAAASPSPSAYAHHPSKRAKRSHSQDVEIQSPLAPPPLPSSRLQQQRADSMSFENTPPPSPRATNRPPVRASDADIPGIRRVDLEGINDEIVEAVIVQLQNTANRPHLVKELATVLIQQLKIVQQSANPCAIVSSRLSTYMKRSCWSALAPCPLAKQLETVHPRRTYFYLTTCQHQPLPDASSVSLTQRTIITPSISSASSGSEEAEEERRRELSPSPEVDLSSPEFDDMDDDVPMPSTPIGSFSGRYFRGVGPSFPKNHRSSSPPLEKDEKEFTQTADGLHKRKLTSMLDAVPADQEMELDDGTRDFSLFGEPKAPFAFVSSPAMRPSLALNLKRDGDGDSWAKLDNILEWDRSPENIELEELDGLLNGF